MCSKNVAIFGSKLSFLFLSTRILKPNALLFENVKVVMDLHLSSVNETLGFAGICKCLLPQYLTRAILDGLSKQIWPVSIE